jgi:hypothetical protein
VASLIFHLVSGAQELASEKVDTLGRSIAAGAPFHEHGLYEKPLVNEYAGLIGKAIRRKLPGAEAGGNDHRFALALSHDVDSLTRFSMTNASNNLMIALNARGAARRARSGLAAAFWLAAAPLKYLARPSDTRFFDRFCGRKRVRGPFHLSPPPPRGSRETSWTARIRTVKGCATGQVAPPCRDRPPPPERWEMGLHAGVDTYRDGEALLRQSG